MFDPRTRSLLVIAAGLLLHLYLAACCDLKVEEAYYWCYAQHPALSYYDHPPMVAWLIEAFSWLGHSSLAVRLPAVLLDAGSALLVFASLRRWFDEATAERGVWLHALLPACAWFAVVLLPDAPLMFCWWLGIYASTRLLLDDEPRWWLLVGLAWGLGMDSKYPALLIPAHPLLGAVCRKQWHLLRPGRWLFLAVGLGLLLVSPVVIWNAQHDWASFRFQGVSRFEEASSLKERAANLIWPAVLLGPGLALAVPAWGLWAWRQRRQPGVQFAATWIVPFGLVLLAVGTRRELNLNWPLPACGGLLLLLARWWRERDRRGLALLPAAALAGLAYAATALPLGCLNALDDVSDWGELATLVARQVATMPDAPRTFVLGYGYQTCSELAYAGWPWGRLTSVNALGLPGLAWSQWTPAAPLVGRDAVVVGFDRVSFGGRWKSFPARDEGALQRCFGHLEAPLSVVQSRGGVPLRRYVLWKAFGYRGAGAL